MCYCTHCCKQVKMFLVNISEIKDVDPVRAGCFYSGLLQRLNKVEIQTLQVVMMMLTRNILVFGRPANSSHVTGPDTSQCQTTSMPAHFLNMMIRRVCQK